MQNEVFLDSSYAIALAALSDELHGMAVEIARQMKAEGTRMVTTHAVLCEIANSLTKQRFRPAAVQLLRSVQADPHIEVISVSDGLFAKGFQLYAQRMDKEWGLTDCISFVVMRDRGIAEALTADEHFRQAEFVALLAHGAR
jgi:hypothetical protein